MTGFGRKELQRHGREKRKAVRSEASAPAIIETPGRRQHVTVLDVSESGARLLSSSLPPMRRDVRLSVNGLQIFGTIVWRKENSFGLRFDENLDEFSPSELRKAVEEAMRRSGQFDRESALEPLLNRLPNSGTCEQKAKTD